MSILINLVEDEQLDHNLDSLQIELSEHHATRLNEASEPNLNFPIDFLKYAQNVSAGGATINGKPSTPWQLAPAAEEERY